MLATEESLTTSSSLASTTHLLWISFHTCTQGYATHRAVGSPQIQVYMVRAPHVVSRSVFQVYHEGTSASDDVGCIVCSVVLRSAHATAPYRASLQSNDAGFMFVLLVIECKRSIKAPHWASMKDKLVRSERHCAALLGCILLTRRLPNL
ncbi:hypothetical protein BCR37DRAFT_251512 [Protomyces lactucae-debilis]|uniref:Uncharacterized protein n=1 Tax=Protomyces lactucae-debilis TaxID=2754530 RepID=A0A1Y2FLE0_PROLT|nr:uncharacterized protein BCR37DRAFT_251512 [Protomyces lactucae-debilis]ORY84783.1 hypothetical protein BCR37DRAFT_251512 [Protomyces lactucae-debilis]